MNKKNILHFFNMLIILCLLASGPTLKAQTLETFTNKRIEYQDMASSLKTVLFMWTTWCPYCIKELKNILSKDIFRSGESLYLINVGERKSIVNKFLKSQKIPDHLKERIVLDVSGVVADKFSVTAIPVYIFLKNGKAVHRSFYLDQKLLDTVFKGS
jgi:thiol-disulfide isomerase/thioredoxin